MISGACVYRIVIAVTLSRLDGNPKEGWKQYTKKAFWSKFVCILLQQGTLERTNTRVDLPPLMYADLQDVLR